MVIQEIAQGIIMGGTIGFFISNPMTCLKTLFDREQGSERFQLIWSLFAFLMFVGFCYSAVYEGSMLSITTILAATATWIWKSSN